MRTNTALTLSEVIDGTVTAALPWDGDYDHSNAYRPGCGCDLCVSHEAMMHAVADAQFEATAADLDTLADPDEDHESAAFLAAPVKCPSCGGCGEVSDPHGFSRHNPAGVVHCRFCGGEGEVSREASFTYLRSVGVL